MTAVLARRWLCPKCRTEFTEPLPVYAASHRCHANDDGSFRQVPRTVHLQPIDGEPVTAQLRLEVKV